MLSSCTRQRPLHGGSLNLTGLFRHFSAFSSITTKTKAISAAGSPSVVHSKIISLLINNNHKATEKSNLDELLGEYKYNLSSDVVLNVVTKYKDLGRSKTLDFFAWAGRQMGFQFDDIVVEYMADFLGRRKLFDDLKCLLVAVSSCNRGVSSRTISICIRFLGRQGRVREALCLFEEMETKLNCKPDKLVFNNILYVLCKKANSECLLDFAIVIFKRIEAPDMYSYSNVLIGLCKFGRFETALELFREMGRVGLAPTRTAVNVLVGELCLLSSKEGVVKRVRVDNCRRPYSILVPNVVTSTGAIEPAMRVFWMVHNLGVLPSAFVFNRLVLELCRLGKLEEAVAVLKIAEEHKLRCVEECYSIVVKTLCEHRCVDEVSDLFGRMISQKLKPKLEVYNSIICMLCKLGKLHDARRVFEIMNKNRCLPDGVTYTMLIHACGEARNWEDAYNLFKEMLGLDIYPHFHTYSLVDKLLRENQQMDLSAKLVEKMEIQNFLRLCKEGQLEAACVKLRSMAERDIHPPGYARDAFKRSFQKENKANIAYELLAEIDNRVCKSQQT